MQRRYGWKPDLPDARDMKFAVEAPVALPAKVDLRHHCPDVYDQGSLGSCTANAIAAAMQFDRLKQRKQAFMPSRLFIYYNERTIENTVNEDAGAMIRDGIKTVVTQGVCPESLWEYNIDKFTRKPKDKCYAAALQFQALQYYRVTPTVHQLKSCLALGFPFVFGFTVYESFESSMVANTGIMPMPNLKSERPLGGHAVLGVGYDDKSQTVTVRNSWGEHWGQQGYFQMPYAFISNPDIADDFWTIRLVE